MLLIYTHQITPRIGYVFRQLFTRILGVSVEVTTKIEVFVGHEGAKISYGKKPLGKELFFQSVTLLFENGFNPIDISVSDWENTKGFFPVHEENSALPFDIFAASFYLLSRYEEYFPKERDDYGRFKATSSLAYRAGFIEQPVVDIWAFFLKKVLQNRFTGLIVEQKRFEVRPVISVGQAFAYNSKGTLRTLGGFTRDLLFFRFKKVVQRLKVLLRLESDPLDTYDFLIEFQKLKRKNIVFFFGLGSYSSYERSCTADSASYRSLLKSVNDYANLGLKVSYEGTAVSSTLKKEKRLLEQITLRPLQYTQCSFYKINLPQTYRNFVESEVKEDYSMGYHDQAGFRAGTCTPFLFYDLEYEVQTPLMVYSFCCSEHSFSSLTEVGSAKKMVSGLASVVKSVNGTFIPVFSNANFENTPRGNFWKALLKFIWYLDLQNE